VSPAIRGRALGIDLGERRIGVALSDSRGVLALPLCTIERGGNLAGVQEKIRALAGDNEVAVVVVGLPLSLDGGRGPAAVEALEFVEVLSSQLDPIGIKVVTQDERFTTVEANRALASAGKRSRARRSSVDRSAAAVLLQAWLERSDV